MIRSKSVVTAALLVLASATASWAADAPTFTIKDAQADFDAAKYSDCLTKVAKLLDAITTPATTPSLDRANLMVLKGEALLHEKQTTTAAEAFTGAATAYPKDKDPKDNKTLKYNKEIATANATSLLIKRSLDFNYTPKTGKDKTPLPIIDASARPAAFTALFNDELSADQTASKPLISGNSLPPIVDFAPKVKDLEQLEIAATGDSKQSSAMMSDLANAAKKDIDNAVSQMNKQADTINTNASKMVNVPGTGGMTGSGRNARRTQPQQQQQGLTSNDRSNLQSDLATLDKIPPYIKTLDTALNTDSSFFSQETTDVQNAKTKIQNVLNTHKTNNG